MVYLKEFEYSPDSSMDEIQRWPYGTNWPVVYIMHNDRDAYVGETLDAVRRTEQHQMETQLDGMRKICLISGSRFNKSVILDLEAFLIQYMQVDGKYHLLNGTNGIQKSDYYDKEEYEEDFSYIWRELIEMQIARNPLEAISNKDSFKYSPYKTLTGEQMDGLVEIFRAIAQNISEPDPVHSTILVEGEAGTGKTILAIYLVVFINQIIHKSFADQYLELDDIRKSAEIQSYMKKIKDLHKIGFVVPMQSLRTTVKDVFKEVQGLSEDMILSPREVGKDIHHVGKYDLLIVDESHRLHRRKSLAQYPNFDAISSSLNLGKDATELDWILKRSKMQILFYDPSQSVRPSDISREDFYNKTHFHLATAKPIKLKSQLRCLGGNDYINYVRDVLHCRAGLGKKHFQNYDLEFFDDIEAMSDKIKGLDRREKLCRLVAGYGWKWISKNEKDPEHPKDYDIHIGDSHFIWNSTYTDWINSPNSLNEIGCIHTVQGYDLNYCGVIFGPEIEYDFGHHSIVIYKDHYFDSLGKAGTDEKGLKEYILNIYVTLMTRGIKGTYVYACNPGMQRYLKYYFSMDDEEKRRV